MPAQVIETGSPVRFTTSAVIRGGPTQLLGLWISNASSTPTVEILGASTSGAGTVIPQFTPAGGTFYPMPITMVSGMTIICGGSVSGSAIFVPLPTDRVG